MAHLRQHNLTKAIKDYMCVDCDDQTRPVNFTFDLIQYSRHILKKHMKTKPVDFIDKVSHDIDFSNEVQENICCPNPINEPSSINCEVNKILSEEFFESVEEALFVSILELKADPMLSESQLNRSLGIFSRVYKIILEKYHKVFDYILKENKQNKENDFENFKTSAKLDRLINVFDEYKSKYKTLKKFDAIDQFVKSETVNLGEKETTRFSKTNGHREIMKKSSFEYVSIQKTLESLLSSPIIKSELKKFDVNHENDSFPPVYYQNSPFWGNINTLRLVLFHDEIEPKNPLSETKTEYKIDMFYFTILNLTRKHNSTLKNIFLNAAIYSKDEKEKNINVVLSKIVNELVLLEKGFIVNGETYFASIAQTSGDNLGKFYD
jgi:hypothetical protein